MAISTFKIYTIENIDYDAITKKYRQLCEEGEKEVDANSISVYGNEVKYVQTRKPRKPLKDDTSIINKTKYLVHTIAFKQLINKEDNVNGVSLLSKILQDVIGLDAYELLKALDILEYIKISKQYIIGKSARRYEILGNIHQTRETNRVVKEYIEKTKKILKETIRKKMETSEFKSMYGNSFAETYIKNLNKFNINEEKLDKIAKRQKRIGKIHYYEFIKESFKDNLKIYSIDNNNRFYHILTSLKRELKQYVNINFSIDCKNSHPLIFNYFIYSNKGISIELSYLISSILYKINKSSIITHNNHYNIEELCNILNNSGVNKSIIAKFTQDELLYLWKTTTGRFWDDIVAENDGKYKRSVIKKRMFAQVFYAKKEKDSLFARQFKRDFPNVYTLILRWKQPLLYADLQQNLLARKKAVKLGDVTYMSKQETALPNIMMNIEAEIFGEILKSLYKKRISAVHIHDCIVTPKTRTQVEEQKVEDVMRAVYKKFGLHPTLSVDKY